MVIETFELTFINESAPTAHLGFFSQENNFYEEVITSNDPAVYEPGWLVMKVQIMDFKDILLNATIS